jgi:hypothetical protein
LWPRTISPSITDWTTEDGIDFQCFKPGDPRLSAYQTHPGEAKTQEIWLAITPKTPSRDDCRRLAALIETPPRLDTSALIRESQAWGTLPRITAADHPAVYAKIEESLAPYFANCKQNVRLFGEYSNWDNGEDGFTPITQLNLNIASAQAYGAYVTQDAGLAEIARRTWLGGLQGGTVYPEMVYDLAGVVWWLDRVAALQAK